jgi:hypothetical protein
MFTDRSRIVSFQTCPRMRFLNYHSQNTGIVPSKLILALSTGTAIHAGVEYLFRYKDVEKAVTQAIKEYSEEVMSKEIEIDENNNQLYVYNEQKALIEALIRIYWEIQYPKIVSEYEVVSIEEEINYPLVKESFNSTQVIAVGLDKVDSEPVVTPIEGITLMARPDLVLRDRSTGKLVVYSLKSSSSWTETNQKQNLYDDQGISELIATEYKYKEEVQSIKMDEG